MAFILTSLVDANHNAMVDNNGNALIIQVPTPGPFIPIHKWWKKIPPFDPFIRMKGDDA